ncbi:Hpt domain-containing protein [Maridesulfovibrio sp.]|uniref:Hpt domain-containing protein n=1 Tax=Maridesulfovibrio sp. TaxID=2795000 RepID=UPI002A18AD2B|nr:Hpt domain-containing protein [Maridesulfovibrio sp.]
MTDRIVETIDADLEVLIPSFMGNTMTEIVGLENALKSADFNMLGLLGHNIKGSALNYGFAVLAEIGRGIELAAGVEDLARIEALIADLKDYIGRVEVRFK